MSRATDSTDLTIRGAQIGDAAALALLMGELGYDTTASEMETRLQSILPNSDYRTFVALEAGKICGMIGTLALHSYEHNDLSGRILALVVTEETRGRGVGRELLQRAEKDFAERNIRRLAVNTRLEREEAHKFYERLGYRRNGWRFVKTLEAGKSSSI
jgi:ribosomal protein S18 acetylase RimI-like enzyme